MISNIRRATLSHYLRFDRVDLFYFHCVKSIDETCESIQAFVRPLGQKLAGSLLRFHCRIDDSERIQIRQSRQHPAAPPKASGSTDSSAEADFRYINFCNHRALLFCLESELQANWCTACRGYEFFVEYVYSNASSLNYTDETDRANLISSILQMPPITRSAHVKFQFDHFNPTIPAEEITNWLFATADENVGHKMEAKFLQLKMHCIQNGEEICDQLKKVILFYNILILIFDQEIVKLIKA